jgi:hypothetical protein
MLANKRHQFPEQLFAVQNVNVNNTFANIPRFHPNIIPKTIATRNTAITAAFPNKPKTNNPTKKSRISPLRAIVIKQAIIVATGLMHASAAPFLVSW